MNIHPIRTKADYKRALRELPFGQRVGELGQRGCSDGERGDGAAGTDESLTGRHGAPWGEDLRKPVYRSLQGAQPLTSTRDAVAGPTRGPNAEGLAADERG
jgi:hypothetical protein